VGGAKVHGLSANDRPALLISECQRGVLDPAHAIFQGLAAESAHRNILSRIALLATSFRSADLPVVHIHVAHRKDFRGFAPTNPISSFVRRERRMVDETPQVEPMPAVAPVAFDHVSLRRTGLSMWPGTDLDMILRNEKATSVVLCGVSTNMALLAGAIGAVDHGYYAILAEDASAGATAETHRWAVENSIGLVATVLSSDQVIAILEGRS
jgi:nicotinamidase-related amidase